VYSPPGHLLDDAVRDAFYAALDAAGLGALREKDNPIVFHDLRHSFGTICAAQGIDLLKIKEWMGHADIKTTMRYLHYVPRHDDAALLTAAFAPGNVPRVVPRTAGIGRNGAQRPGRTSWRRAKSPCSVRTSNPQVAGSNPAGGGCSNEAGRGSARPELRTRATRESGFRGGRRSDARNAPRNGSAVPPMAWR
jgi:Phage integrase family